jgi:two-component system response regulator MprA
MLPARESLLVVEDEPRLLRDLTRGLQAEGYAVLAAPGAAAARRLLGREAPAAAVLDRMLPDGDGLNLLRDLRAALPGLPVIVVTARDAVPDRVAGLDAGADDYLVKPFAFAELLARLRALLRRSDGTRQTALRAGDLELDLLHRRAVLRGDAIELTQRQCELLEHLVRHAGRPVARDELLRDVWHEPPGSATNVVEVSVNHLRRKFHRRGWPALIETVRGEGYMLRGEQ